MDLKKIIGTAAPLLATALGFPAAAPFLALLAHTFNADPENLDDVANKISLDPDAKMKLNQLEMAHETELRQIIYNTAKLQVDDVENARQTEIERQRYGWMLPVLGIMITVGFFANIMILHLTRMDTTDHDVLYMMLGVAGTSWGTVVQYYFGSSHAIQKISEALGFKKGK